MVLKLEKLLKILKLNPHDRVASGDYLDFPLKVSHSLIKRIAVGNLNDPILLQFLPQQAELKDAKGFNLDPLDEQKNSPHIGLVHKYPGRVLLLVTDKCSVNCRFCFRKYFREKISEWVKVFDYIENDQSLEEVILSGGDPLMLDSRELNNIFERLANIPHVKRVRIHTRLPVTMPEKVNLGLLQLRLPVILVIHCNHPNEINDDVVKAIGRLQKKGIVVFNQSVLLRHINDDAKTLMKLSERLFSMGVIPYYLHVLDKVKGTRHFDVSIERAKRIHSELRKNLSGYLVPRLVVEKKWGKVLL